MLPLERALTQMLAMFTTSDCAKAEQLPLQLAVNRICAEDIISPLNV
ncbi:molybdopterin molybdenumtransferase MoeA, partial [Pasteurella multocida]|nr:molybdopterin molybdenumtransferase MoeA [Pasteurella multocida]